MADITEDLYRKTFDVNVLGVLNVAAEAVAYLTAPAYWPDLEGSSG